MASTTLYHPLNPSKSEIRVVKLHPGGENDPIHCDMNIIQWEMYRYRNHEMYSKTEYYEALSYEWGSPGSQREIMINGQPFMVRENLWNALHQFRSAGLLGPIWIDAICINQADIEERNAQVSLMHLVYGSADLVRVWLGKEGQGSGEALDLLWKIFEFVAAVLKRQVISGHRSFLTESDYIIRDLLPAERTGGLKQRLDLYKIFDSASKEEEGCAFCESGEKGEGACTYTHLQQRWQDILSTNDGQWLALSCLLNRSYWSRIWIVQEYVLAQHKAIHCGGDIIGTENYAYARTRGRYYKMDTETLEVALSHLLSIDLRRHSGISLGIRDSISRIQSSPGSLIMKYAVPWLSERRSLLELLIACKNSKASEPRDKIYAILGLAWDIWEFDIKVDYSKSISEVKFDVIRWYMSLNYNNREEAATLWNAVDEMIPEALDSAATMKQRRMVQMIINEVRPIPARVQRIYNTIEELDSILKTKKHELSPIRRSLYTVDESYMIEIFVKG